MDYPVALSSQIKQYLRSLRKSRGLTQSDLARRLGVGQSRVADIEANPGAVSVDQLLQILAVLNAQLVVRDAHTLPMDGAAGDSRKRKASTLTDTEPADAPREPADPPKGQW
ncbi:helix-turn-helix domain-containing protein [Roseateles sp. SL47]|uniref:helix-turn-helix domain-containing protein n=1 Tax=Roseateles sp. SL47 TaxID=2995138 RepID=UPI0022708EAF|nr:helix-turn-helix domain-containing protein [Roseateles sp. SL47]WAC73164.1 helix-turn-helix domain-containing protein [Roseateles sp. SL47]